MFAASPGLKHHPVLRVRARADQPATMPTTRLIVVARMTVPYAFLVTYQTYYLPAGLGGSRQRPATDLPRHAGPRIPRRRAGLRLVAPTVRRPIDAMGRPLPVRTDPMSGRDNGHRG